MQRKDKLIENKVSNFQREISLDLLHDFQDPDFKEAKHKERVKQSLINHGIVGAVHVWLDTTDNKIYIVDGHTRKDALIELQADGYKLQNTLPCVFLDLANKEEVAKVLLTHNAKTAKINQDALPSFLETYEITLEEAGIEIEELHLTTFDDDLDITTLEDDTSEDDCDVEPPRIPITAKGDLYELNGHRVLCGDSTVIDDVERLMQGERADLAHNDPPYGMKKENEGIANDNLNFDDLLQFNHDWITLQFSNVLKDNGSWYCWGIDEPLMDIYSNIIKPLIKAQKATFRNLITWDKGSGQGQMSDEFRSYAPADEKCLFVICGAWHKRGFSLSQNADNYFEGWNSIVEYLKAEKDKAGLTIKDCKRIAGHSENSGCHWFDKSQWMMPTKETYNSWREHCKINNNDAFKKEYEELKKEYYSTRAYFDNTHDNMTNVWDIGRTKGAEREEVGGHATPKPLELCQRVIKSSCPQDGLVVDAFLGSGSTLIAAEQTNRKCYGIELEEKYCDVIVRRWTKYMQDNNKEFTVKRNGETLQQHQLDKYLC